MADSDDARLFASESGVVAANIRGCIRCSCAGELLASAHVCEVVELVLIVLVVAAAIVLRWLHIVGLPNASTSPVILCKLVSSIAVHFYSLMILNFVLITQFKFKKTSLIIRTQMM